MKTLIVEESIVSRSLLEVALRKWGYDVVMAETGDQAFEILLGDFPPTMAVLDSIMPGKSGLEICRDLRKYRQNPYIYVLLLTGQRQRVDIIEGLESGADDYLTKPYDLDELRARLQVGRRIVELQQQLLKMATHDSLTELENHAAILESLDDEIDRSERKQLFFSLILADMDHFKLVNDTYGHQAGDAVLVELANRLRNSTRPYDHIGRYGGEEFMIILSDCDECQAIKQAERLRRSMEEYPISYKGQLISVTISLGVAVFDPSAPEDLNQIIARADAALYRAKRNGRNRVEIA